MKSGRQLYMDNTPSMLARNYEVSCLTQAQITEANNWRIKCDNQEQGSVVTTTTIFQLFNEKVHAFLYTSKLNYFNESNCGGRCPIMGQLEVSGVGQSSTNTKFSIDSGLLFDQTVNEKGQNSEKWIYNSDEVDDLAEDDDL
jgi:dolichyl-phosphate-mannose--protein O-mannosyl transferase